MSQPLRVGIVGGGGIAKAHVIALRAQRSYFGGDGRDADVVVIADASGAAAEEAANAYDVERWTTDWHSVIADDTIDVITVATPNDLHAEVAIAAAGAGKHVLCEKPLAHTVEAGRRMVAAAERAGVVHSVDLNYRNVPAIQYAKRLIDEGRLGDIVNVRAAFLQDWGIDPAIPRSWKFEASRAGAGPLLSLGCHAFDLAQFLVGDITDVVADARTWITERPLPTGRDTYMGAAGSVSTAPVDVEDLGNVLVRFRGNAIGTFQTSRLAPGRKNHCFLEIHGMKGTVVFDYERLNEIAVTTEETAGLGLSRIVIGPEQDGGLIWTLGGLGVGFAETVILHMRGFLRAIAEGRPASPSFLDGLRAQAVAEACVASATTGSWVTVEDVRSTIPGTAVDGGVRS